MYFIFLSDGGTPNVMGPWENFPFPFFDGLGRHRLTASVAYLTTLTYASTNGQWPVSFPCLNPVSSASVQFSYDSLYAVEDNAAEFVKQVFVYA